MARARPPVLVADIGGTNARFALARGGEIRDATVLPVKDFSGPAEAIRAYLAACPRTVKPRRAALAFAGPVEDDIAQLTNGAWHISAGSLCRDLGLDQAVLVNDLAAVAWAVPALSGGHLFAVGGGAARAGDPAAVIGPGTGLGVAAWIPNHPRAVVLATEGGHVTMAPADQREAALLEHLRGRFGHVSAERVLSGPGLENLYHAAAETAGQPVPRRTAEEIMSAALADTCQASAAALDSFCAMLGTVAGNLALTLGARGGVYIAGGIVPRFVDRFAASGFRERFEAKGRFRDYLKPVPTAVIVHPAPAFLGLLALLDQA